MSSANKIISANDLSALLIKIETLDLGQLSRITQKGAYRHRKESFFFMYNFSKKHINDKNYMTDYIYDLFRFALNSRYTYIIDLILNDKDLVIDKEVIFDKLEKSDNVLLKNIEIINQHYPISGKTIAVILSKILTDGFHLDEKKLNKQISLIHKNFKALSCFDNFDFSVFESTFNLQNNAIKKSRSFYYPIFDKFDFLELLINNDHNNFIIINYPCFTSFSNNVFKEKYYKYVMSHKINLF